MLAKISSQSGTKNGGHIPIVSAYLGTILVFFLLCLIYKIPLSTDDWYWGLMLKQGQALPLLCDYFYRLPVCKVIFNLTFPVLLYYPFLGKLLIWGVGIVGLYLPISWFIRKYNIDHIFLPIISLLVFFAPNQFEVNFLLSSMPFCFGYLFCGLGFHFFRKDSWVLGTFFYLLSFFTLESFISLAVLLEVSVYFKTLINRDSLKKILYCLSPVIISYITIRLALHFLHPYTYEIESSLRLSQLRGLIFQCFLIDFYKLNSILSSAQLMLYGFLFYVFLRDKHTQAKQNWITSLLIIFFLLITTSSYYYFLGYSASRALTGQVAFCWGMYLLFSTVYLSKIKKIILIKILFFILFISIQITNHALIFEKKQFNYSQIEKEVYLIQKKLSKEKGKLDIDLNHIRSHFKRDWIFASTKDVQTMFKFRLSPEDFKRINFIY